MGKPGDADLAELEKSILGKRPRASHEPSDAGLDTLRTYMRNILVILSALPD
jgi:hypothetical protein